jgi:hypothetical protein
LRLWGFDRGWLGFWLRLYWGWFRLDWGWFRLDWGWFRLDWGWFDNRRLDNWGRCEVGDR